MELDRRELFRIIGASLVAERAGAQHQHGPAAAGSDITGYKPRALTEAQYNTLDVLTEVLLPADETGPGAHDAGVAWYIDTTLHYGDPKTRSAWRNGLDSIETAIRQAHDISVAELSPSHREQIVAYLLKNESNPETDLDKFAVAWKSSAISAYYLSEAGRKSLGYKGDTAITAFAGCTHPEHQA